MCVSCFMGVLAWFRKPTLPRSKNAPLARQPSQDVGTPSDAGCWAVCAVATATVKARHSLL